MEITPEELAAELKLAEEQGLVRVPADKTGLYGNTLVYRSGDQRFSPWRGDITCTAGRLAYPIYVKKEHAHLLGVNESGPGALMAAINAGLNA